jgi:hypothetical protein
MDRRIYLCACLWSLLALCTASPVFADFSTRDDTFQFTGRHSLQITGNLSVPSDSLVGDVSMDISTKADWRYP